LQAWETLFCKSALIGADWKRGRAAVFGRRRVSRSSERLSAFGFLLCRLQILNRSGFSCAANYPNKTALGMVLWHLVRIIAAAFMIGFNNKLLATFNGKKFSACCIH